MGGENCHMIYTIIYICIPHVTLSTPNMISHDDGQRCALPPPIPLKIFYIFF